MDVIRIYTERNTLCAVHVVYTPAQTNSLHILPCTGVVSTNNSVVEIVPWAESETWPLVESETYPSIQT